MSRVSDQECLRAYRERFPERPPKLPNPVYADETVRLISLEEAKELFVAPAEDVETGIPPERAYDDGTNKYLWVILADAVPFLLEEGPEGRATTLRRAKHTNLTGGEAAHVGGEIWFRDAASFWLSGASGRYHPRGPVELEAVVECFTRAGYSVCSFGWDEEAARAARFLRGPEKWT